MRLPALVPFAACLMLPVLAAAQDAPLRLPDLTELQAHATGFVNVTLGPQVLGLVSGLADGDDPDLTRVKQAFQEITSVTVRSFKFDTDVHPGAGFDDLRRQLAAPWWSPLVQVHDRDKGEDVGIYLACGERAVNGLVVLAVSPRQITLVHVAGTLDPSRIAQLRRAFEDAHSGEARTAAVQTGR